MAAFAIHSPVLLANDAFNENPINSDNDEFSDDFDDSLEDFYGDEEFVSIATGGKVLLHKAPAVATVITAEQMEKMGAQTVAEVLENVPGLHVYPSPFNRLNNSFSIRGIHTDQNPQVLFLVNGSPIREEYTGARPQTFRMPVHAISRIEIIRGPGSAIYGADAYAGVINVITKELTQIKAASYGVSFGSFNSSNLWYQNAFSLGEVNLGFALETLKSDGDDQRVMTRDLQSIFDDLLGTSASKAPGALNTNYNILDLRLSADWNDFNTNLWYWDNDKAGVGAGAGQALDPSGTQDTTIYQFDVNYDWTLSNWDATAQYSFYKLKDRAQFSVLPANAILPLGADGNLDLGAPVGIGLFTEGFLGNPQPTEKLHSLDFTMVSNDFVDHKIRIGFGASHRKLTANEEKNFGPGVVDIEALTALFAQGLPMIINGTLTDVSHSSNIFVKDVERKNYYLSMQDQWKFANDWELTTGIRYDHYDDFGTTINPRIALLWEVSQSISTKLLYGRAFRAPAFDTLYAINNPVGIGNPNLEPETIDTIEFSINQHLQHGLQWSLNLFSYDSENLIEFIPDSGASTTTAQNFKNQKGYGFEGELSWKSDNHVWEANYSWQKSEDKNTSIEIPLAPQQLFHAIYYFDYSEQISLNAKMNWIGDRDREVGDTRDPLDSFSTIDLAIHWKLGTLEQWKLSLIGKNIFDEHAYEPTHPLVPAVLGPISDYPIQGRSVYLQLSSNL
jgi:iron complex outermembrane receptor protein